MESGERTRHSFVLVIWSEGFIGEGGSAVWRGTITDVVSNERRTCQSLDDLVAFLIPYLKAMGVEMETKTGVRGSVQRWSRRVAGHGEQPKY
jgi:hypothetical protein